MPTADPLSDILDLLNARCLLSGGLSAGGPWIRRFAQPNAIKVMAMLEGSCWLLMDGLAAPVRLETGDVMLVNGKHAMTLMSDLDLITQPENTPTLLVVHDVSQVGTTRDTFILGGHVAIDTDRQDLLLDVLPPLIHIGAAADEAGVIRWLLDQLAREVVADRPGATTATAHLAQLMFVQAIRAHLQQGGATAQGWLQGLGDERIAPALRLLHGEPSKSWSLGELARAVGMSRTTFAERFRAVMGTTPLAYLTDWRMYLAERDLRRTELPVASVAYSLGYTSESAFSNAFKRVTGVAPRRYRTTSRSAPIPVDDEAADAF